MWLTYNKLYIFTVYNMISFDICLCSWNRHHNQENEHVHHCQVFLCRSVLLFSLPLSPPLTSVPRQPLNFRLLYISLHFQEFYIPKWNQTECIFMYKAFFSLSTII